MAMDKQWNGVRILIEHGNPIRNIDIGKSQKTDTGI